MSGKENCDGQMISLVIRKANFAEHVEKLEPSYIPGGNAEQRSYASFTEPQKVKHRMIIFSVFNCTAVALLVIYPRELNKNWCTDDRSSIICNSQNVEQPKCQSPDKL